MGGLCPGGTVKQNPKDTWDYTNTTKTTKQEGPDWNSNHIIKTTKPNSPLPEPKWRRPKLPSDSKPSTPPRIKPTPTQPTPSTPTRPWIIPKVIFKKGTSRGSTISILAFEVANTIVKGVNLLHSLSKGNIQVLKKEILHSDGVRQLVSTDMKELLSFVAADKRQEFEVFSREVIRFGDLCKDSRWHKLDRYFSTLDSDYPSHKQHKVDAETTIKELTALAQHTSELYREQQAFERFEHDFRGKIEEAESSNLPRGGESLAFFQSELGEQKKLVRSLQKKSLWSKNLEEIMQKLVDVVTCIHQAFWEAFGTSGIALVRKEPRKGSERLGEAGVALHYANVINQINIIASRPTSLPPNLRDQLYRALPTNVKTALRSRLLAVDSNEQLSIFQVKAEMEKTLKWLVPVATNTIKSHQEFGWVAQWAKDSYELGKNSTTPSNMTRLQTLYYADKQKADEYILELVTLLHRVISLIRRRDHGFKPQPLRSPTRKALYFHSKMQHFLSMNCSSKIHGIQLSQEDRNLLDEVIGSLRVPGISKSQEFGTAKKSETTVWPLSRSTGSSPSRELGAIQDFKTDVKDIMDGLEYIFSEAY
ncbi:hypothetical protein ACB092_01G069500 [Castanea dentata]